MVVYIMKSMLMQMIQIYFSGDQCRVLCFNGGTCNKDACICKEGFSGKFCEARKFTVFENCPNMRIYKRSYVYFLKPFVKSNALMGDAVLDQTSAHVRTVSLVTAVSKVRPQMSLDCMYSV